MFYSKQFNEFKNVKHTFFSKKKGFSKGIYKSLNCGLGSDDNKNDIIKNLDFVANSMNSSINDLILMNQTHSNKVIVVNSENRLDKKFDCDALITKLTNVTLGVLTADCVPLILYDEVNKIIGCVHAGWRGALSGVIENTLNKFKTINHNNRIYACIGPCIGKNSYEVGNEFHKKFLSFSPKNSIFFKNVKGKFFFDIRSFVNHKLKDSHVTYVDNVSMDTCQDSDNFFSYRRSTKLGENDYGRCISTICLKT